MSALNRILTGTGSCGDLLCCVYNLNRLESDAYFALLSGPSKMDDLVTALDRERSTVYRAVQKLVTLQLAVRDTVSLTGGGYCHVYAPVSPDTVHRRVQQWAAEFNRTLECALDGFMAETSRRAPSGRTVTTTATTGSASARRVPP